MATGLNSIASPTAPESPTPDGLSPAAETQRALRLRQGLKRLLHMEAISSFADSFAWEKEQVAADTALVKSSLNGQPTAATEESEMLRNMVAGDLTVNHFHNQPQPAAQQPQAPQPPTAPQPVTKSNGWLKPLLLGAALAGTGAGGYALYDYYSNTTTPSTQPAGSDGDWKLDVEVKDRP